MTSVIAYRKEIECSGVGDRHCIIRTDNNEVLIRMNDDMEITWMNIENSFGKNIYFNMLTNLKKKIEPVPAQLRVLAIRELLSMSFASRGLIPDPLANED